MRKSIQTYLLMLVLLVLTTTLAQSQKKSSKDEPKPDPKLTQKDNDYIDRQDKVFLDTITSILSAWPPVIHDGRERSEAKMLMDAVCHDPYAAYRGPVRDFFHNRVDEVIRELENVKVDKGAMIWKIYNMGFIVRTRSVTVAFDLVSGASSGSKGFAMSSGQISRLANQCDVLFISHKHQDHAEKDVAEEFFKLGKPVVAPEQVWNDDKIFKKITHLERVPDKIQNLPLASGKKLEVIIYPGHQMRSVDVNVSLVMTPEGISIAHLGDQINEGDFMVDFAWIDKVAKKNKVDIMMPNCWTNDIERIARGFNPALIMPGHELELGHSIWDRLPFWGDDDYHGIRYRELKKSAYPVIVMVWGESYHYLPKANKTK